MNHITNYYKNKCEVLTEQLNSLKNRINTFLKEDDAGDDMRQPFAQRDPSFNQAVEAQKSNDPYQNSGYDPNHPFWYTSNGQGFMILWNYLVAHYNNPLAWNRPNSPPYMASPQAFEAYLRGRLPVGVIPPPF